MDIYHFVSTEIEKNTLYIYRLICKFSIKFLLPTVADSALEKANKIAFHNYEDIQILDETPGEGWRIL